eukprot:TRINITY_DN21643_c0_g1_i1.p1 TRINITY_DN21643_c0_g1~~TRINITY_DN21643_c0_g1_i1.p1  ORF type:complete len:809 (+),score=150.30 TRINITY_DN21643_c0_g1_i1:134-2560(+)
MESEKRQGVHCKGVDDTRNYKLKVTLGPDAYTGMCKDRESTKSIETVMDTCQAFCGKNSLPIVVGHPALKGFNHQEMDQACLGSANGGDGGSYIKHDPDQMATCVKANAALVKLEDDAADLIAKLENLRYAQLDFKTQVKQKASDLATFLTSKEFDDARAKTGSLSDLVDLTLKEIQSRLGNVVSTSNSVSAAARALEEGGKSLQKSLPEAEALMDSYIEHCSKPFLGVGPKQEYLLDVCNQHYSNCLQSQNARHVGCCCAVFPAAGSFGIPGAEPVWRSKQNKGGGGGRRLEPEEESTVQDPQSRRLELNAERDLCAEAELKFKKDKDTWKGKLNAVPVGKTFLKELEKELESAYPEFFTPCSKNGGRRLSGEEEMEKPKDDIEPQVQEQDGQQKEQQMQTRSLRDNKQNETTKDRRLQMCHLTGNSKTTLANETLNVAHSKYTQTGKVCSDMPETADANSMLKECSAFCGSDAIPLLLGSPEVGLNQSSMDRICINSQIMKTDSAKLGQCMLINQEMHNVDIKTRAFVSAFAMLKMRSIEHRATVGNSSAQLRSYFAKNSEGIIKRVGSFKEYNAWLTESIKTMGDADSSSRRMKSAMYHVGRTAKELKVVLDATMQKFEGFFLKECIQAFTAQTRNQEYLLDICPQIGTSKCIDHPEGEHVGCCCAYTPVLALGQKYSKFAIPGLEKSRRVSAASNRIYHICGESAKELDGNKTEIEKGIAKLGQSNVVLDRISALKTRYFGTGMEFCPRFTPTTLKPKKSTTKKPKNTKDPTQRDTGGAESAASDVRVRSLPLIWLGLGFSFFV